MEWVRNRRLHRLVVLWERPIEHRGREQPADSFAVHDEWSPRLRAARLHRRRVVRHVPRPLLLLRVPDDAGARWIPGLTVEVGGGPVVHHPPVERPAPSPAWVEAHARRVVLCRILDPGPPLGQIPGLWVGTRVDPVAGRGGAVVLQLAESIEALP